MTGARRWACAAAVLLALACLFLAPAWVKPGGVHALSLWAVMTIAAIGLNLTVGYAGQISLAQGAFVGIGAYATAVMGANAWPLASAFAVSGLLCFAIAVPLGYLALRVHRHGLAVATLAFGVLANLVFANEQWLTGIQHPGMFGSSSSNGGGYLRFCLAVLVMVSAFAWWLVRSPWGRAFQALRENPVRAGSLGVDARRYAVAAFAVGAALGGMAGALYAPLMQRIDPSQFTPGLSVQLLLIVILGGGGYFFGPFVGALFALLLAEWLHLASGASLMIHAAAVMAMLAFWPAGLLGIAARLSRPARTEPAR
jgi:branched-chain amino acid transport system permease protein